MIVGRKANGVAVAVAPRERLDLVRVAQPRSQDGAVAHTRSRGLSVEEGGDRPPGIGYTERGKSAGKSSVTRGEHIPAQGDVLAWNIGLASSSADDAIVRRRPGSPVDPSTLERQLSRRAGGQPGDDRGDRAGYRVYGHNAPGI